MVQVAPLAVITAPEKRCGKSQLLWEPLLAIAEIASHDWMKLARDAALKLSSDFEQSQSIGVELLADIQ